MRNAKVKLRQWDFMLVPSERSLEAVDKFSHLRIVVRNKVVDLFPITNKCKNWCVLLGKIHFDKFPQTTVKSCIHLEQSSHVETICLLSKLNVKQHIEV